MKQRFVWAATLTVILLLTLAASCAPAAAPTPAPAPNPAPATPPTSMHRQRTTGTIAVINGNILTLTTEQGPITVKISSDNTTIQNITACTLGDLHEGEYLMAMGSQDASGNITATSIMTRPQVQSAPPPTRPDGATRGNPASPRTGGAWRGAGGTLTKIDGNSLTLTTSQGTVTVTVGPDTTIQKTATGTLADLHEGQSLSVMGSQDADGNVAASFITVQPLGQSAPPSPPPGS